MPWSWETFQEKLMKIRQLLEKHQIDAIIIENEANFAWLTGGRGYVRLGDGEARAKLLVNLEKAYLISNNIESQRLIQEELEGLPIEVIEYKWWQGLLERESIIKNSPGNKIAYDIELAGIFKQLRYQLTKEEVKAYRNLGYLTAKIVHEICWQIQPGESEQEIASRLAKEFLANGIEPLVLLVGVDERAYWRRHPLPTKKSLNKYALIVVSVRQKGLFVSCTRLVHFGPLDKELAQRHEAVCKVDVAYISNTQAGTPLGQILEAGIKGYSEAGYPDEWQRHHQGGLTGYASREVLGTPECKMRVAVNQAYAWNPSISGVKSEDTILVTENGPEIITKAEGFPYQEIYYAGAKMQRPAILVRN